MGWVLEQYWGRRAGSLGTKKSGCCSFAQSCPSLCDPMDCSTPGLPVHHYLLAFAQTHVHWTDDAIRPSHPLLLPSPPALNLSQHENLYQWVSSSNQMAKVLEFQLQHQSFQQIFRVDFLWNWQVWSPCSPRDSQESSSTPQLECSAFFMVRLSDSYMTTGKTIALTRWTFDGKSFSIVSEQK